MQSDYSDMQWRRVRGVAGVLLASLLAGAALVGCVHYHAKPLAAGKVAADFEGRSLADAGLRAYLETNQVSGEWPRRSWELESLTLAAFYFSPELDVARAQWGTARAGSRTAAQVPNPTLNVTPGYNATTFTPSPWIPLGFLDIPIETAGKRGYRMAQAGHLSEAARLNILGAAWQVRGKLRRALVDFYAASEQERLLAAQRAAQEENVNLLEGQLGAGAVSPALVTRERIALDTTRLAEQDAKRQRGESRVAVAEAIGIPVGALDGVEISFAGLERVPPGLDTPAARRQALLGRPDVLAGLAEYAASQSALQLEIARQYPDLHIGPGYQYDQGDSKWSLALTVTLPVFNQNQGPVAEAAARREETSAKFNALQARVVAEVERGLVAYRAALEKSATADSLLANLEKQERVLRGQLEAGEVTRGEVIASQVELAAARLARADAVAKAQQALGQLEEALQSPVKWPNGAWETSPRHEAHRLENGLPQLAQTVALPHVKGGFDLMAVDLAGRRLFLNAEDNNTTEVIDLAGGRLARTITGMQEPKWVVYRPELHKLYVANGNGAVRVLDSRTFELVRSIEFKEKANNLRFDAKTGELFVGVGKTFGAIGVVDTRTDKVTEEIPLANFPKQFEVEGNFIYVNVPEANHVAVIDRRKKAVAATWPVTAAKGNVPMGFDRAGHRLFIGCEPGKLAVLDSSSGKQVAVLDIAPEPDGVYFDAKRRCIYISCGSGSLDVVRQVDADHYEFAGRVATAKGAATSLFVPELEEVFVAVPQREGQGAEVRIYKVGAK
jgi:outer membrane protein, heavy metal efflux system